MKLKLVVIHRTFQEPLNFGIISEDNLKDFIETYVEKISKVFELKDVQRQENNVLIIANEGKERMFWKIEFSDVNVDD